MQASEHRGASWDWRAGEDGECIAKPALATDRFELGSLGHVEEPC